jgi:hypothetical protein
MATVNDFGVTIDNKIDIMTLNNSWNDKNEKIVISIGEEAASYKWMHEKNAAYYRTMSKIVNIVMIIFNTGLSAQTFISEDDKDQTFIIFRKIFIYIVTVLSVIQNFLKYDQLSEQHLTSAMSFSKLYHDIQQQMCMYRRDRINATIYTSDTLKHFDNLVIKGPSIDEYIIQQFKKIFQNTNITIPNIADRIQKIETINELIPHTTNHNKENDNDNDNDNNIISIEPELDTKFGISNLKEIHNAFKIHGDITDHDIRQLNKKRLEETQKFEQLRSLQHHQD